MELTLLTYNIFLLILYSIVAALSSLFYQSSKKTLYLYTVIFYIFVILDDVIIFVIEFIDWFAEFYNQIFTSIPTFKTIIFAATLFCMIQIMIVALNLQKKGYLLYLILIPCLLIWMFIPIMHDNPLKVYIYYLPFQIATFLLSLYALYILRKNAEIYDAEFAKNVKGLAYWTLIFSVLIALEDMIVIFKYDVITSFQVSINYRSMTNDIMYIGYSIFIIWKLTQRFTIISKDANRLKELPRHMDARAVYNENDIASNTGNNSSIEEFPEAQYSKFYRFCKEYQLTSREEDIFFLLLENKNNQEISNELVISIGTAKTHVHNIFQKIDVTKRQQLLEFYDHYRPDDNEN